MLLKEDEEEEKRKRQEDIKRLFGTNDDTEPMNNVLNNNTNDIYTQRIENVRNLFGIDDDIQEPEIQEEEEIEIKPQMLVTNTNPSDVAKPAYEWEEEQKDNENSNGIIELNDKYVLHNGSLIDTQNNVVIARDRNNPNSSNQVYNHNIMDSLTNSYAQYKMDKQSTETAQKIDKEASKGILSSIWANTKNAGMNFVGGMGQSVFSIANLFNNVAAFGARASAVVSRFIGNDEAADRLDKKYKELVEDGKMLNEAGNYISTTNSKIDNDFIRTTGNVASVIGRQVMDYGTGGASNVSGAAIQAVGVAGSSFQEVLNENPNNLVQATLTATTKATFSYVFEKFFDANLLTRGAGSSSIEKEVTKLISKNITSKFGRKAANFVVGVVGENVEELMEDNTDYLIDSLINNKELPSFEEWWNNTSETVKITTLSTIIMNLLGFGGESFEAKELELSQDQEFWIKEAQKIIDKNNLAIMWDSNSMLNLSGAGIYYNTILNQDGNIEEIKPVAGKIIENPNNEVDISPVIIYNKSNKSYNIIDDSTGIMIDSTPYKNMDIAQKEFNNKMINLDNASINNINNKIAQATVSIDNKMNEIASNIDNENVVNTTQSGTENVINDTQTGANNVMNGANSGINNTSVDTNTNTSTNTLNDSNMNTDTYQTSQNQFTGNYNNETTNYSSNSTNASISQNNALNDVTRLLSQISDNSIYSRQQTRAIIENISRNIPTVEIQQVDNTIYINSLDREGNVVHQQQVANRPYTGGEIRDLVNNAVYNADLSGINSAQINEIGFRDVSDNETVNYTSESRHENIGQNKKQIRNNSDIPRIYEQQINNYKQKSAQLNKINGDVVEINNNIFEGISKKKQSSFLNEYLRYEVKGNDYFVDGEKIIANGTTTGKLKNGHTNFDKRIEVNLRNELKANIIGNLDNIVKNSKLYQADKPDTKNHSFADTFDRRRTLVKYNNHNYEVMFEIGKRNNINTLYGIESIKRTNKNRLSLPKLTSKKGLQNTNKIVDGSHKSNTSISQNNQSVKNNTNINNKSTQNKKNNTSRSEKNSKNSNNSTYNEKDNIKKELHNRIQNAIISRNSKGRTYLGTVSDKVLNKIKSLFGIEVTDRRHVLADNDIRHMIKEHGNPEIEKTKGQIAITTKDIEKIPDIIENYDRLVEGNDNREGKTIRYIKKYSDKISYVVEVIPEKGNALKIKTMWKKPVRVTNSQKTPSSTSKTESGLSSSTFSKSIPQNNQNVKDNGIRAERTSNTTKAEYDNLGNKLTKAQQDFFKDSKVRDENGNLLVMYHGTEANVGIPEDYWFTIFDIDRAGNHGNMLGNGFYFTSDRSHAEQYAHTKGNIYETYLNIKKPLELGHFSTGDLVYSIRNINPYIEADIYKRNGNIDGYKVRKYLLDNGYDGIHSGNTYVALNPNQIKNVTNKKPTTSDPDIRYENTDISDSTNNFNSRSYEENEDFMKYLNENEYLKNLMEVDEKRGETYAHSAERLVEQEIRKLEQTNGFDNSIPVTKLTDIDREIENYLGRTIGKGHFRERARGIYNKNIDRIRVKEYKDLDNVFHELGHALDLGGRITVDKASLSDELLAAVRRHGGYENESLGVQLDEGFAEILKTYAINKDIVKQDYPKSYKVLEDFKASNVEFGKFITKLQEDTYNYIHQSPRNRGLSNQSIGEQTDKETITIEKIAHKAVKTVYDSNYEVKRTQEEFSKATGHKPTPSQNAYLLTRLASGVDNKIVSMLTNGYVDENGNRLMPGLGRIGEILGNDAERINDLRAYLAAKRDLEYKAKTLKTGLRTMDSKKIVEQFYNDAQIQEAAQVVYDTLDGVLQYAVDNGLITEENAKSLRESNVFYVPFQRVIEGRGNQVGRRGAVSDIIKQRTGSELDIKDVLENIVTNSANIIKQVENNNILRAVYEQGEETGMKNNVFDVIPAPMRKIGTEQLSTWEAELKRQGIDTSELDLDKTIDLFAPNNNIVTEKDGSHIVSFFDKNGKRKYLQFYKESTDIFNALMGLDKNANSTFLKIMRLANMPLRYGATMANVGFAIPNMISDTVQASIFSEAGFIPVVDNVLGVLDVLGATNKTVRNFLNQVAPEYAQRISNLYDIYQQTGATSSMRMAQYRKSAQEIMREIYGTKNSETLGIKESFKPLKRLMDILTYIPELSESSTRFRVFERNYDAYINKGMSETDARIQAAIESRDATQDFGRTGTLMREVNQLIPFSAARVGSAYTFAERAKANPGRTVARVAILLAVTMAIKAIGYDDDEIEELNQRKKDDNFVLKIGDTVITIKKPQGILRSIVNLTEYIQDLFTGHIEEGKEGERLVEWATNAIMDNMPADSVTGLVFNAITPVVENAVNKDFYYNTDIVKSYDLDLPNAQQYYDYTSQFAIWLGQIFNYSPAKIDNLISGYLGGVGTQLTDIIDWVSGKLGFSVEEPDMGAEDNAIGKRFVVNVNENSSSVDEIYEREEELTKKLNGGTITEKENAELESIKSGISKISALNKQIKAIKQDLSMPGSAKADAIRPLQEQKVDVARQALGKDAIYTNNTDELESLEFYPSRSELSLNGLTLELTEEMKTEYMNMAYELYQKYTNQGLYNEEYLEKIKTKVKDAAKKKMMQKYRSQLVK